MTYSGLQRNVLCRADCAPRAEQPRGHLSCAFANAQKKHRSGKNVALRKGKKDEIMESTFEPGLSRSERLKWHVQPRGSFNSSSDLSSFRVFRQYFDEILLTFSLSLPRLN